MKNYKHTHQSNIVPYSCEPRSDTTLSDRPAKTWRILLGQYIGQVWHEIVLKLTPSNDPQIYEKRDRHGNTYFHVYDPLTGLSSTFSSEDEIRIWLDQRFYYR